MRNNSISIFVFTLLLGAFLSSPVLAAPSVSLNLLDSNIIVNESFDVEVWVNGDDIEEDLLAFGFDVATAGGVFSYDGYTVESGFFDFSAGPNNVTGDVFTGIPDDDVLLTTLSFTGLEAGTGKLSVLGIFDQTFYGLFYEINGFDINASLDIRVNESPVPEPSALLLLGAGCLAFVCFRRKKMA